MAAKLYVSSHAAYRWAQRIEGTVQPGTLRLSETDHYRAVSNVLRAYHRSIKIPGRWVTRLRGGPTRKWGKPTYHMTVDALLVVQGGTVVTVLRWGLDPFASCLVQNIFGVWPEEGPY